MNDIFLGMPEKAIQNTLCRRYLTTFVVETTAEYNKSGIYSAERDDTSRPIIINWGDGTVEQVNGNINQKVHTYASVGEFTVNVSNVKTFAASANNANWYNTTSQNRHTFKKLVNLNKAVMSIGNFVFSGCSGLTSITIPDSVMSIEIWAFSGCSRLTSVTIPDSVTSIGDYAFKGCSGLTSVTFDGNAPTVGANVFTDVASGCKAIVDPTKSGWPAEGTTWNKLTIEYKATSN